LVQKAKQWIQNRLSIIELDFENNIEKTKSVLKNIEQINVKGIELLLGNIYDEIGFSSVDKYFLKYFTILRISNPASKLKTIDLLSKYYSIDIDEYKIYRYLDNIYKEQREKSNSKSGKSD